MMISDCVPGGVSNWTGLGKCYV